MKQAAGLPWPGWLASLDIAKTARLLLLIAGSSLMAVGLLVWTSRPVADAILWAMSVRRGIPTPPDWSRNLQLSGIEALVVGALLAGSALVVLPRRARWAAAIANTALVARVAAAALVVLWLPVVLLGRSAVIAGQRYWWLGDDAMISMRYARNLADGLGLVWNAGERVEGYTNLLWTLYMALVHLFPFPSTTISLVVLLTNLVLSIAAIPFIIRLVRLLGGSHFAALGAVAGFVLSKNIMYWTTYGYETALLTLLFLVALTRLLQEGQSNQARLLSYLLIGLMGLVRADAVILSILLYAVAFVVNQNKKQVLAFTAISLLLPLGSELFRIAYYGDVLPNTAYLKTTNWSGKYTAGLAYVGSFLISYALPLLLATVGAVRSRQWARRAVLASLLVYMAYVAYVGGDAFGEFRFFVPFVPVLLALALVAVEERKTWGAAPQLVLGALCLLTIPLITPGYPVALLPYSADTGNVELGLFLKANTPPTSKVADTWAGSVFYFSERPAVDLLGKSDPVIARRPANPGGTIPGHNKFDFAYSLGVLKPQYVVSEFKLPVDENQLRAATTGDFAYRALMYFDPTFRAHCLAYPVAADTWRTIFACRWS